MNNKYISVFLSLIVILFSTCHTKNAKSFLNMEYLGKIKPKNSGEITASYWGIQAGTLEKDLLVKASGIGVKWTRLGASWPSIEKKKGIYNWEKTDKAFDAALSLGITPFVTLGGGNSLYTKESTYDDPKLAEIYGSTPGPPTENAQAMDAWLHFVQATVERYRNKIQYWEIWNEPNHRNYWGAEPDASQYGILVNKTASLIKSLQSSAKIIAGSMAGLSPEFIDGFLSANNAKLVDIITYHNYGDLPETRIYRAYDAWKIIDKYNSTIELWQGECGYPSHSSTRDFRGTSPWGLNIQAKWLLRQAFTDIFFCKASMSNYFKLVHIGGRGNTPVRSHLSPVDSILGFPARAGGSRVKTVGVNEKCLLSNPDLEPKPGYYAYQNLCAVMDSRYKRTQVMHEIKINDPGMFYGIGSEDDAFPSVPLLASFRDDQQQWLFAFWLPWHAQEYTPDPANCSITLNMVNMTDPVLINLIDGKVYRISDFAKGEDHITFNKLPLLDFPFIIAERASIVLK